MASNSWLQNSNEYQQYDPYAQFGGGTAFANPGTSGNASVFSGQGNPLASLDMSRYTTAPIPQYSGAVGSVPTGSAFGSDKSLANLYDKQAQDLQMQYDRANNPTAFQSVQDWSGPVLGAVNTLGGLYGQFGSGGQMDMNKANIDAQKTNIASLKQNMADKKEFKEGTRTAFA